MSTTEKRLGGYQYYDKMEKHLPKIGINPYTQVEYVSSDGKNPESVQEGAMKFVADIQSIGKQYNKRYNSKFNPYKQMKDKFLKKHKIEDFNEFIPDDGSAVNNPQIMAKALNLFNNYKEEKERPIDANILSKQDRYNFERDKKFIYDNFPKNGIKNVFSLGTGGAGKESTLRLFNVKKDKNLSADQQRNFLIKNGKPNLSHISSVFFSNNNARAIRDKITEEEIQRQQNNKYGENNNITINYDTTGMTQTMAKFYPEFRKMQKNTNKSKQKVENIAFWIYTPPKETLKRLYHRQQYNGRAVGADFATFCFNLMQTGHKSILEKLQPNQTYIIDNSKNGGYPSICASMIKGQRSDVRIHNMESFFRFVQSMNDNLMYGTTDPVPIYKKYTYKEPNEKERILVGLKNFCQLYGKCSYENIQFSLENKKLVVKDKYTQKNIEVNSFNNLGFSQKIKDILNYIIKRQNIGKNKLAIKEINEKAFVKKYGKPLNNKTKQTIKNIYKGPKITNIMV